MNNNSFNTIPVSDGTEMDVYTCFPENKTQSPAIILFQEAYGVNSHIRNVAKRLCDQGYAVIAPELFHRTGKNLEFSYTDFTAAMPHFKAITQDGLLADIRAAYDWLQQQEGVIKDKIGAIGFCLGGRVSFLANTILQLSAAVSYYGGGADALAGEAPKLHGPQLFYWGGLDKHITPESIDKLTNAVKDAGKDYTTVTISYADHGFNCDERESYNPQAAKEAWAHTLAFFSNYMK